MWLSLNDDRCGYRRPRPFRARTFTAAVAEHHPGAWPSGHFPGAHVVGRTQHVGRPLFADMGTQSWGSCHPAENSPGSNLTIHRQGIGSAPMLAICAALLRFRAAFPWSRSGWGAGAPPIENACPFWTTP